MPENRYRYYEIALEYDAGKQFHTGAMLTESERHDLARVLQKYKDNDAIEKFEIAEPVRIEKTVEQVLDEIVSAVGDYTTTTKRSKCQNCGCEWPDEMLNEVVDIEQRVAPGEEMPSGECPYCQAVCHPI